MGNERRRDGTLLTQARCAAGRGHRSHRGAKRRRVTCQSATPTSHTVVSGRNVMTGTRASPRIRDRSTVHRRARVLSSCSNPTAVQGGAYTIWGHGAGARTDAIPLLAEHNGCATARSSTIRFAGLRPKMATPQQKAAGRKSAKRFYARVNKRRIALVRELRRAGEPLIPEAVLKKLQALHLPPNEWVYNVCLRELMREA